MSRLTLAIDQIVFARNYTLGFLEHIPDSDWFRQPAGGVTHIGWQIGHLAIAQYRLALWRIRDKRPEDNALLPPEFVTMFGYGSVPVFDATKYPSQAEIRAVLDRVHEQVLRESANLSDADLDAEVVHPHPNAKTKLYALLWCANHEMMHAGQIGLLRRQLGYEPL
jgi:hypothetical protein